MDRPTRYGAVLGVFALAFAVGAGHTRAAEEDNLRELDRRQGQMVATGDAAALEALAHPSLRINAPTNEVLTREEFLRRIRAREIAFEQLVRTPESIVITGDIGVVMGREEVTPTASSESGRLFGPGRLIRRYTNIYIRDGYGWKYLARHANVVPQQGAARASGETLH